MWEKCGLKLPGHCFPYSRKNKHSFAYIPKAQIANLAKEHLFVFVEMGATDHWQNLHWLTTPLSSYRLIQHPDDWVL